MSAFVEAALGAGDGTCRSASTCRSSEPPRPARRGRRTDPAADVLLDQYYTCPAEAERLYRIWCEHFDPHLLFVVEPSAGTGAWLRLLPLERRRGIDKDPKGPGIDKADFLETTLETKREITAIIGNPPFGRQARTAIAFFNHAARQAGSVSFILPRSFRKASVVNKLDPHFQLVREEPVREHAFLFRGRPYHVPAVFQIWVLRPGDSRRPIAVKRTHQDFKFVKKSEKHHFCIQRVGADAGRVHHVSTMSDSSHYFVRDTSGMRGTVEGVMSQLDLASPAADTAGCPSLAKSEIVSLYEDFLLFGRRNPADGRSSGLAETARTMATNCAALQHPACS